MGVLGAIVRHEWRLQLRSLRFRLGLVTYLAANAAPVLLLLVSYRRAGSSMPGAAALDVLYRVAPFLAVLWAVLVAGVTARVPGESQVLLAAPLRSASWVLAKSLALLSLTLAVSLVAFLAPLGLTISIGGGEVPWTNALLQWAVSVAPRATLVTVGYFGLLRILHSEMLALITGTLSVPVVGVVLGQPLLLVGIRLDLSGWSGFGEAVRALVVLVPSGDRASWRWWLVSDAAWDWRAAMSQVAVRLALPASLAILALGLAVAYVGRCRPEHAPGAVRGDHPLRNFLRGYGRLRRRLRSDADLDGVDRAVRVAAVALALAAFGGLIARDLRWGHVAAERYRVEVAEIGETTPRDLELASVRIEGTLERSGRIDVAVSSALHNAGVEPRSHLAFELDRTLDLDALVVEGDGAVPVSVKVDRGWQRVELDLEPPIAPGGAVSMSYRLRGRPGRDVLNLQRLSRESFAASFERHRDAARADSLSALAGSWRGAAATAGRVRLRAPDLMLAPRWDPWSLTPAADPGESGREVLEETWTPGFELSVDLELPHGWLLVDGCGVLSEVGGGRARHRSRCRLDLPNLVLYGGRREGVLSAGGSARLAVLPGHEPYTENVVDAMARTVELSARAWPGLRGLAAVAAVEMPRGVDLPSIARPDEPALVGRMIVVPEAGLRSQEPIAAPELVAALLSQEIEVSRPLIAREERAVMALLRAVLLRRMGLGASSGWMWPQPHLQWRLGFPLLSAPPYDVISWQIEMPALLHSFEAQLGPQALIEGARAFVSEEGRDPVGVRELLAAIGRAHDGRPDGPSSEWLDRAYQDFFVKGPVPKLDVRDVAARREGRSWRVTATLRNAGSGQVRCPVVVRGEVGERELWVVADAKESVEVSVAFDSRPRALVLDPRRECFLLRDPSRPFDHYTLTGATS